MRIVYCRCVNFISTNKQVNNKGIIDSYWIV